MSTVASVITDIRYEINDIDKTRFSTDTPIIQFLKRGIRRASRIAQRNGLEFAKKFVTLTCTPGQAFVNMPQDFDVFIELARQDIGTPIPLATEWKWEQYTPTSAPALICKLDHTNGRILLRGTPTTELPLSLWYYPRIDPTGLTPNSPMPWDGRLDDILIEYVSLRLKNVDGMDITVDQALLTDMENQILLAYRPNTSNVVDFDGWMG